MTPNPILPVCAASLLGTAQAAVSTHNPNNDLIFVPVQQCRLVDTRTSSGGDLVAGVPRNFLAYGKVASQGGNAAGCPQPKRFSGPAPVAMSADITAVGSGASANGVLKAFPAGANGNNALALVNYTQDGNIANAATITLCRGGTCPGGAQLSLLSMSANVRALVDVLGYFYPKDTNILTVATYGGDFTSPVAAMAYLKSLRPAPNAGNPWVIKIDPGVYELGATPLTLSLEGVTVSGSGPGVTALNGDGGGKLKTATVMISATNTRLEDLAVTTTSGSNSERYAVAIAIPFGTNGSSPSLFRVHAEASGGSLSNWGLYTFTDLPVEVFDSRLSADGAEAVGIEIDGSTVSLRENSIAEGKNGGTAGSRGVQLVQNAKLNVFGGSVRASSGVAPEFAVAADVGFGSSLDVQDSNFLATGDVSIGVLVSDPTNRPNQAELIRTTITGATNSVQVGGNSRARIGGSLLNGSATTGAKCVFSRNASSAALNAACQPSP